MGGNDGQTRAGPAWIGVRAALVIAAGVLAGCSGPQSALDPAGRGAERVAALFWWMTGGAALVWAGVVWLFIWAVRFNPDSRRGEWRTKVLIIGGGAVFPTVVLTGLLVYGLRLIPVLLDPAPEGSLRVRVTGEQWWWRVRYETDGGEPVELANEIHLPAGEPVELILDSPDVIHAFWIPSLGGKVDMIPGRTTRLKLEPERAGIYRGACAEYCGASHALMAFYVVVQPKEEFEEWLAGQAAPARAPSEPLARAGGEAFISNGCGACHTIRGTSARGMAGPDLTHAGSRLSLAAGTLENEPEEFARWIAATKAVKPEVHMPRFGMLPPAELRALAAYLEGLK